MDIKKVKAKAKDYQSGRIGLEIVGLIVSYFAGGIMYLFFFQNKIKYLIVPIIFILWIYLYRLTARKLLDMEIRTEEDKKYLEEVIDVCRKKRVLSISEKYYKNQIEILSSANLEEHINLYEAQVVAKKRKKLTWVIIILCGLIFVPFKASYKWYDSLEESCKKQLPINDKLKEADIVTVIEFEEYAVIVSDDFVTYLFRKRQSEDGADYSFLFGRPSLVKRLNEDELFETTAESDIKDEIYSCVFLAQFLYLAREGNIITVLNYFLKSETREMPLWGYSAYEDVKTLKIDGEPIDGVYEFTVDGCTYYIWWKDNVECEIVDFYGSIELNGKIIQ